ncbi:MAG: phytoene/squalene synthase family protein [Cytophagaceae bacterium]|nr:phytoene/squalene synthase family protein [Cytophagaceae bacterium]MDW8456081.1 phytoene/squalene synthase family protein [Cytophagaceae bacterium]
MITQLQRFDKVAYKCSTLTTKSYSTSFSLGTRLLSRNIRKHIYAIYGFVRFADEIVDTFHEHDKKTLLENFKNDTYRAIEQKISLNPILHSFQKTVNEFRIDRELIDIFLKSMEMDLHKKKYNHVEYDSYILGSAEVVGLMCLKVFCNGDENLYNALKDYAMKLGAAFQKINFLRDLKADYEGMGRVYFPDIDMTTFNNYTKKEIEKDIERDFESGLIGIKKLPKNSRLGVFVAYTYYRSLFNKVRSTPAETIREKRIRINNLYKYLLFTRCYVQHSLNVI